MSKLGKLVETGIYRKRLKDGSYAFKVLAQARAKDRDGKSRLCRKVTTCKTLHEARQIRDQYQARRLTRQEVIPTVRRLSDAVEIAKINAESLKSSADKLRHMARVLRYFGADAPLETIDEIQVHRFKAWLNGQTALDSKRGGKVGETMRTSRPLSESTKNHALKTLRNLLNIAKRKGWIRQVPTIPMYAEGGHVPCVLTMSNLSRLIRALPGPPHPHRLMVMVALVTGLRRGDIFGLRWSDLASDAVGPYLEIETAKTRRRVRHYLPVDLCEQIRGQQNSPTWLFVNPETGRPYNRIRRALMTAARNAGIEGFTGMHQFRKLNFQQLAGSLGYQAAQQIGGWSSMGIALNHYGDVHKQALPITDQLYRLANGGE